MQNAERRMRFHKKQSDTPPLIRGVVGRDDPIPPQ